MKRLTTKKMGETYGGNRLMCQQHRFTFAPMLFNPNSFVWDASLLCRMRAFEVIFSK
ncbi:MAG: hypothetical protein ACK41O_01460 [Runella zeae]